MQKRDTDAARTRLAACLAEERRIEVQKDTLIAQMEENRTLLGTMREDVAQDPALWNGYRYWLPLAQAELERLDEALAQAEAESARARAVLMGRVREEEGTKTILTHHQQEQAQHAQRQEQAMLDERAQYHALAYEEL